MIHMTHGERVKKTLGLVWNKKDDTLGEDKREQ